MKLKEFIDTHYNKNTVPHFLSGAWITALGSPVGWWGIFIAVAVCIILSFVKEKYIDKTFNSFDIMTVFSGCTATIIIYVIIQYLIL